MKTTGIVRRIDDLGRVVIPKELRQTLGMETGDGFEIFVDGDKIILRKYQPGCYLCDSVEGEMHPHYGHRICTKCIKDVSKYADQIKGAMQC
ncbi:AbrB/MazE/SpoVT family DNA-binding domain-containing protein [Paenibacillus senegalimassiliensis]|uniref:AbrB/MazE/SpoVT family DNA-binding domain-containing protein n=1 Tax=Paenibacillus senegalimassiliensis TaxID=1737426 RepID=UPI00073F9E84|nr:AbrB/MazE/SpoVT family DNA-binding domain-containing protein [Paenibacillus senegalimassiliensis]